jgi:hypothetical protein
MQIVVDRRSSKHFMDRQGKLPVANPLDDHLEEAIQYLLEE